MKTLRYKYSLAMIVHRQEISLQNSEKKAFEIVINAKNVNYFEGDCLAIIPENNPGDVDEIIAAINVDENTIIGGEMSLRIFLRRMVSISSVPKMFLKENENCSPKTLLNYVKKQNPLKKMSIQDFCSLLPAQRPRLYSITSSKKVHGDEIHLIVVRVSSVIENQEIHGVCSHYLTDYAPMRDDSVRFFLHPSRDFHLPKNPSTPLIMIANGMGIAPFKAFMENRSREKYQENNNWLIFGEQRYSANFYWKQFWENLQLMNILKLSLAFSRDGDFKEYVQHRIRHNSREFWQWISRGASIYVCGNRPMGRDVDNEIIDVIANEGSMDLAQSKEFLANLSKNKRYLKDIY